MIVREWDTGYTEEWPFGIHLDHITAEVGNLSVQDRSLGLGLIAGGGAPLIHDIPVTTSVPGNGGGVGFWDASAAIIRGSELRDLWVDDLSPATITGNVIYTIGVNENNTESTGGEAVIRDNTLGYVSLGGPVTVEGNQFPESMASEDEQIGIGVTRGGGWIIRDNVINGRQTGIQALPDGRIEGNVIEGNGVGLSLVGDPPVMSGNRICDNTFRNVSSVGSDIEVDLTTNEICPDE